MDYRRATFALAVVVIGGVFVMTSASAPAKRVGSALFGGAYFSSEAVVKNGERHPLVEGTRIRVKFVHDDDRDLVQWRPGCNIFGAPVEVKPAQLEVGQIVGTDAGCNPKALYRQERWVARLFESDPTWKRQGRNLRLIRGDDVIRLRRPAR